MVLESKQVLQSQFCKVLGSGWSVISPDDAVMMLFMSWQGIRESMVSVLGAVSTTASGESDAGFIFQQHDAATLAALLKVKRHKMR